MQSGHRPTQSPLRSYPELSGLVSCTGTSVALGRLFFPFPKRKCENLDLLSQACCLASYSDSLQTIFPLKNSKGISVHATILLDF